MRARRTRTNLGTPQSLETFGLIGSQGAGPSGVPSGRHQVPGPEGKGETPMISMIAPLDALRTQRRSPVGCFFAPSAGFAAAWGSLAAGPLPPGACCDRARAVRPTAARATTATTLSFSHIIIFRTPLVRSATAAGNMPGAQVVAARAVDRTSSRGTAARAAPVSVVATPTAPGARPRRASLSRNLIRPLVSRVLTVATG